MYCIYKEISKNHKKVRGRYGVASKVALLLLCLLLPFSAMGQTDEPFFPNRYLSDPDLKDLFCDTVPNTDAFDLNRYYDSLEPPGQDGFMGRYSVLTEDAFYFLVPAAAVLGTLYLMPEEVTNWSSEDTDWQNLYDKWKDNVSTWHWDEDDAWINYIGHPYFGSTYFIYARHYGYSRLESVWFSFAISSFYEIGLEAWAEQVSIQDMIFTPLLGWAVAEFLLPIEYHIQENGSEIFHSKILGGVALFLIDPFGHVIPPIKSWADSLFNTDTEVSLTPMFSHVNHFDRDSQQEYVEERYGFQLTVRW